MKLFTTVLGVSPNAPGLRNCRVDRLNFFYGLSTIGTQQGQIGLSGLILLPRGAGKMARWPCGSMSGAIQPWGLFNCISLRVQQAAQDKGHSVSVLQYKGRANPKESQKTEKKRGI